MNINKFSLFAVAALGVFAACDDINEQEPEGSSFTAAQSKIINSVAPTRAAATFNGMFSMMGEPEYTFGQRRADDFGYIMQALSLDIEGSDMWFPNSGYNWFSPAGEYTSRYANYANPYVRYKTPYNQISICNEVITSFDANTTIKSELYMMAQAHAMRAFAYLQLAPYFQFRYIDAKDKPCVPIVTEETSDFTDNPRATVEQVYKLILSDLNYAIDNLKGYNRTDKSKIDQQVAYGLRARAYLNMAMYKEAAADAAKALEGYTPASISDVKKPAFCNITESNWIWGIDITEAQALINSYATSASWLSSFSGDGYAAGGGCYAAINHLLYEKIPASDVRKGWWMNENNESPNLASVSWDGVTGNDIAPLEIDNVKMAFYPYVNVKFGILPAVGSTTNSSDWPLMRAEEMELIYIEGLAKSNQAAKARTELTSFVKSYRDPKYTIPSSRTLDDEIWFQRRVELWGEGFAMSDIMRLAKPVVRFHDKDTSSEPAAYSFNIKPTDGWLLMRFPQDEINTNFGIIDNTGGNLPVMYQNASLRDGVTD